MSHTTYHLRHYRRRAALAAVLGLILLVGMGKPTAYADSTDKPVPKDIPVRIATVPSLVATGTFLISGNSSLDVLVWFDAYAKSRALPVVPNEREAIAFGPWTAEKDYGATDARADGSLTEWADNYYITHSWSEYGQQILTMQPGDSVLVNGRHITVEGAFDYPKAGFYNEIMQVTGQDALVLQTCFPNSNRNRIVYGH